MIKKTLTLTPGVYLLTVPVATSITAYLIGGGGGGGACSDANRSAYGGGGALVKKIFTIPAGGSITIAVGEGGQGGRVTVGSGTDPYGSILGSYGGRSLAGYNGGPSGGTTTLDGGATVGTGGGGGGASAILMGTVLITQAAGGAGAGGGIYQYKGYTRSGTPPGAASNSYRVGSIFGAEGAGSGSGGGGGGGKEITVGTSYGLAGNTEKIVGQLLYKTTGTSVGFGGSNGYTKFPTFAINPTGSTSGGAMYGLPTDTNPQTYYTTIAGNGGAGGYYNSPGSPGIDGLVILELVQNFNTSIKSPTGTWSDLTNAYYKINGAWKAINTAYVKDAGVWKKVYGGISYTLVSQPTLYFTSPPETVIPGPGLTPIIPTVPVYTGPQIQVTPNPLYYTVQGTTYTTVADAFKVKNIGDQPLIVSSVYPTIWRDQYFGPSEITFDSYIPGVGSIAKTYAPGEEVTCDAMIYSAYTPTIGTGNSLPSSLTFISNAVANNTYIVPLHIAVTTPVALIPSGSAEYFNTDTFIVPAGVTDITVVMQGPGSNGTSGGQANYSGGQIDGGDGGDAGQFKIITMPTTPGGYFDIIIGKPGSATEFNSSTGSTLTGANVAATGSASTLPSNSGFFGDNYGGNGGGAFQFNVTGALPIYGGVAGGGSGGKNSVGSSYDVVPGQGQGYAYINTGGNGWSATMPGAGGGGGGLDEGSGPGIGGSGQPGYVKIYWGLASNPVKIARDYLAATPSVITSGQGGSGDFWYFGDLYGIDGQLTGLTFGSDVRHNNEAFVVYVTVINAVSAAYLQSTWRDVHLNVTGIANCSFSETGNAGTYFNSIAIPCGDMPPSGPTHIQTKAVWCLPVGEGQALLQINAAGTVNESIDPETNQPRMWITQPENYQLGFTVSATTVVVPPAVYGVASEVSCNLVPSPQVVEVPFLITVTVKNIASSVYTASVWRNVSVIFPTVTNCYVVPIAQVAGDSSVYDSPRTFFIGDIGVGETFTRDFNVTSLVGGLPASFDYLASGIVDNSSVSPWKSTIGSANFTVNTVATVYTPTADPIGVTLVISDTGVPSNPTIGVPFTITFNLTNVDLGVGYRIYTPMDWSGVVLSLTSLVNCTVSNSSYNIGTLSFGNSSGDITITVTPTAIGAYSLSYMATGTVTGASTNPWSTTGGVPVILSGTVVDIPAAPSDGNGSGSGNGPWLDTQLV